MKLMTNICGLPVIRLETGKTIGRVERTHLHAGGERLRGLSIKAEGLRARRLYAGIEDVELIGDVSVIVRGAGRPPEGCKDGPVPGVPVWSAQGQKLGWMSNALIDERTGDVAALEISMGYWDDLLSGRLWAREFTVRPCGVIAVLRAPGDPPGSPFNSSPPMAGDGREETR